MPELAPNPQQESLGFWIFRLNRAMFTEFSARLATLGVTGAEWTILSQLHRGLLTPVDLANYMRIDRAAVTRFVHGLEQKGLVSRRPHATDRRSTVLALTAKGKRLMPKLLEMANETNQSFLALLTEEQGRTLVKLLAELGARLPDRTFTITDCKR